jgi:hypothetical protein
MQDKKIANPKTSDTNSFLFNLKGVSNHELEIAPIFAI